MSTAAAPSRAARAAACVQLGRKAAVAYERPDLDHRLAGTAARLADPAVALLVVGEFKQGKSTLVNALLNATVCPTDDDVATAIPTVTTFGEPVAAVAVLEPADDAEPERRPVDLADVRALVLGQADPEQVRSVEIEVPRTLLRSGMRIVDTPGIGGLHSAHGTAAIAALADADAALFVTDSSQELTASELQLLRRALAICPRVALVQTKTDLYPRWSDIVDRNRQHLAAAQIDIPVLPVSSLLRRVAVQRDDASMNDESGFPALVQHLRVDVIAEADRLAASVAARDVVDVADHLASGFRAERAVLADPAQRTGVLAELEDARRRADALRAGAARWQTTLNDGIQDLNADIDHDLRGRIRSITQQCDERIDAADPAEMWDEFEPWLRQLVAEEVAADYQLLRERAGELARQVAELFLLDERAAGIEVGLEGPGALVDRVDVPDFDASQQPGALTQGLGALRGSYGGMAMFGMIGGLMGLTTVLPITLGLGAVMGAKQLRDDRKRQLAQRRQQAKQVARKYVDGVNFAVGKDSRDTLRRIHRDLRDGYASRAQELAQSAHAALQAAEVAATRDAEAGQRRMADVDAELGRLDALRARAATLVEEGSR